ncbi:MAG: (2Fe-2S) ferredoxin domain-containing protein, partial [Leptolyngbyaceae cyanobacterium MO_188.B28]|nr:(2Fe-2S) ferredoxin domain-containing protein [Leptolyngbyaceae cyanobacterium MO_188.B28]
YQIKLPKHLRIDAIRHFTPGEWVFISGMQKVKLKTGEISLKADNLLKASPGQCKEILPTIDQVKLTQVQEKSLEGAGGAKGGRSKVLVCSKSSCMKRGGKAICKLLESELREQGLTDQITIKLTGCMGHCKSGPNLVFMPDKARYRHVSPKMIPNLINQHFRTSNLCK